jgi:flagellar biosynthesis GTPase FlhF
MQIANPIYDVVFKFLMEDSRAAKTLLSALLQQEIVDLTFLPQEISVEVGASPQTDFQTILAKSSLTIYRMDFSAKIRTPEGEKQIIIELQKARLSEDITRFRSYLGKQYLNKELFFWAFDSKKSYKAGIPIFPIYFLGYELARYKDIPVIKIGNWVQDRFSQENLPADEPFVQSLFHQGMIVLIPNLKGRRRDQLEKLLSIFDQSNREKNFHILNINENDFSEEYRHIIRRLQAATQSEEMRNKMLLEDDIVSEIQELERSREEAIQERKEAIQERDEAMQEIQGLKRSAAELKRSAEELKRSAEEALKQTQEERKQKELAEQNAQEERTQKELAEQRLNLVAKNLAEKGFTDQQIAEILGIKK